MRAVIQRISRANVNIDGREYSSVDQGLLVFLGVEELDNQDDIDWLAGKITRLRIFDDEGGTMNRSVLEIGGSILVISQFTLHASTKKGNRPSYIRAANPEFANSIYEQFINQLKELKIPDVKTGKFGADMQVCLINDGPVTITIDTKNKE